MAKIARISAEGKSGKQIVHEMFMAIFQDQNDWAECETDAGMVSLIQTTYHTKLYAGTPDIGHNLFTIRGFTAREYDVMGRLVEAQI